MLELCSLLFSAVTCLAPPDALDELRAESAFPIRVARDEVLLLAAAGRDEAVAATAREQLPAEAIAVVDTDSFAGWMIGGEDFLEAFSRLSAIAYPPTARTCAQQGLVAGVPAKVVCTNGAIHMFVSSVVSHHLRQRVSQACEDLGVRDGGDLVFDPPTAVEVPL